MNSSLFKKILSFLIIFSFLSVPASSFAQQYPPVTSQTAPPRAILVDQNQTYTPTNLQYSQANTVNSYTQAGSYGMDPNLASSKFGACVGGSVLVNAIRSKIQEAVGSVVGSLRVPTGNAVVEGKETGSILGVGWDQMGWCMVNSLIEAIGDATVNWINSGFQGNPVFVTDPEQFFTDVADMQAGVFLNELSNGFLCSPLESIIRVNLANSYNSSMYAPQCTFSGATENLERLISGQQGAFSWVEWNSYTQNPYNNPFGATVYTGIQLNERIASALGVQSKLLDWGGGFLSSRDPKTGVITSPGSVVEKQVNDRLGSGQRRLEIADEFDEVVNALVNQLIRVAVTEMTQTSSYSQSYDYGYSDADGNQSTYGLSVCPNIPGLLQRHDTGASVSSLQKYLQENGYFNMTEQIDGKFSSTTQDAVIEFQTDNRIIPADGLVGTTTRRVIGNNCIPSTGI